MSHAGGLAVLMQKRGPGAYLDLWDRSMLFSFRSMIVSLPPSPTTSLRSRSVTS